MNFLDKIMPGKQAEARKLAEQFARSAPVRVGGTDIRDFEAALSRPGAVIAEVKHRSPSNPDFRQHAAPARLAAAYARGGAAALSVVTDAENFGTSLADVAEMRRACDLPVLVKDFIIHRSQIQAAWAAGADAVLLIARLLDRARLETLLADVHELGLQALVECHDEEEIDRSADAGARILGINNRDLALLTTDLNNTRRLLPRVPYGVLSVSESGINRRSEILDLQAAGAGAFLVGHALLLSPDPGRKVRELTGRESETRPRVKICGLTSVEDARAAHEMGADLLGMVLSPGPRQVSPELAAAVRQALPDARLCGVFVNPGLEQVTGAVDGADLDLVQLHGERAGGFLRRGHAGHGCARHQGPDPGGSGCGPC
jgi:indole-3-glycerol phosphate synthase